MKINTPGIIIRETNIGENDKLLVILTAENGLIHAFADGARRMKNRNCAALSLLGYCDFTLYRAKDAYRVNDAAEIELFFDLRYDLEGLSLAQYFCELVLRQVPEETGGAEYLQLLLNALHLLTYKKRPPELIKAVFELRFAALSGYMPDLTACAECKNQNADQYFFDYGGGHIYCDQCQKPPSAEGVLINKTVLAAMRHIVYMPANKIFSFHIPEKDLKLLSQIGEKYVSLQTEFRYKTLDFYYQCKS